MLGPLAAGAEEDEVAGGELVERHPGAGGGLLARRAGQGMAEAGEDVGGEAGTVEAAAVVPRVEVGRGEERAGEGDGARGLTG